MTRSYPSLLSAMQEAILSGDLAVAECDYPDKAGFPAAQQLRIYVDAYRLRLVKVLGNVYPTSKHYLSEPPFNALALAYVESTPSTYFNIDRYPLGFASFVIAHAEDGFAGSLAQLESAIHDVYQRPDSEVLDAGWVAAQGVEAFADLRFQPRRALMLLALDYPAQAYLEQFRAGETPTTPAQEPQWLAVVRHRNLVRRHVLGRMEFALLSSLIEGATVGEAFESMGQDSDAEAMAGDVQGWFARWLAEGFFRVAA